MAQTGQAAPQPSPAQQGLPWPPPPHLNRLAQAHLVGQDAVEAAPPAVHHPVEPLQLVVAQLPPAPQVARLHLERALPRLGKRLARRVHPAPRLRAARLARGEGRRRLGPAHHARHVFRRLPGGLPVGQAAPLAEEARGGGAPRRRRPARRVLRRHHALHLRVLRHQLLLHQRPHRRLLPLLGAHPLALRRRRVGAAAVVEHALEAAQLRERGVAVPGAVHVAVAGPLDVELAPLPGVSPRRGGGGGGRGVAPFGGRIAVRDDALHLVVHARQLCGRQQHGRHAAPLLGGLLLGVRVRVVPVEVAVVVLGGAAGAVRGAAAAAAGGVLGIGDGWGARGQALGGGHLELELDRGGGGGGPAGGGTAGGGGGRAPLLLLIIVLLAVAVLCVHPPRRRAARDPSPLLRLQAPRQLRVFVAVAARALALGAGARRGAAPHGLRVLRVVPAALLLLFVFFLLFILLLFLLLGRCGACGGTYAHGQTQRERR